MRKIAMSLIVIGMVFVTGCGDRLKNEASIKCDIHDATSEEYGDKLKYSRTFEAKFGKDGFVTATKQVTIEEAVDEETYEARKHDEFYDADVTYDDINRKLVIL